MSDPGEVGAEALRLDEVCREKARTELRDADLLAAPLGGVGGQGDVLADVLLVKGDPGPGDLASGKALAGEDGIAIGKALDALGLPEQRYAVCSGSKGSRAAGVTRLRHIVEAVDPSIVIALDGRAAADVAEAFGVEQPQPGETVRVAGRQVLVVEDFAASLADDAKKRRVWGQLKALGVSPDE